MNYPFFVIILGCAILGSVSQVWGTSSTWMKSHTLEYVRTKHFPESLVPPPELNREQRYALCAKILDFRLFIMNVDVDEKTAEILKYIDLYGKKIFADDDNSSIDPHDRIQTRVRCIEEEAFQLHVLFYNSMPNLCYIYVRIMTSIDVFAIAEPEAVLPAASDQKQLEKSFLDTINFIITDENSFTKIHYDICDFDQDNYLRLCSAASIAFSSTSERKVFPSMRMSLGCWRQPVHFLFERMKDKRLATNNVEFPSVEMLTCEPSSDAEEKFYIVADINEPGSVFVLKDCPADFDCVRNNKDEDTTYVYLRAYVRSIPVLLYYYL